MPAALALAEEDELEAVAVAVGGVNVAGVIPPLGAEAGMIEVVARKLVAVAREGLEARQSQEEAQHGYFQLSINRVTRQSTWHNRQLVRVVRSMATRAIVRNVLKI